MKRALSADSALIFFLLGWAFFAIGNLFFPALTPIYMAPALVEKEIFGRMGHFVLIFFLFSFSSISRPWWHYAGVFFFSLGLLWHLLPGSLETAMSMPMQGTLHWVYFVLFACLGLWVGTVFRRSDLVWIFCFLFAVLDILLSFLPVQGFFPRNSLGQSAEILREMGNPILLFFSGYFIQITYSLHLAPLRTFLALIIGLVVQFAVEAGVRFLPFSLASVPTIPIPFLFFVLLQWRELKPRKEEIWMAVGFSLLFLLMLLLGWWMLWLTRRIQ